jgi:PAS domain S-box-containing protein
MNPEQSFPAEIAPSWRDHAFRALVENLPEVVGCFDLQLRHLYVSPAIEAQTGVAAAAFLGKTHAEFAEEYALPAPFAQRWTAALEQVRDTGEPARFTFDFPLSSGCTHFEARVVAQRDETGRVESLLAITHAHTPLSHIETQARQLAAIVESSDRAIVSTTLDGTILTWNPGAERIYGYRAEQIVGEKLSTLTLRPEVGCESTLQECLREMRVRDVRTRHVRADGSPVSVALTFAPIRDVDGHLVGASVIGRDVTEEESMEQQARRAERLSSLATLISGVAHELNNPLSAIKSFAQLMLLDERPAEDREALEIVHAEADRAAGIVSNLRLFARDAREERAEPLVPVQIDDLVRQVLTQREHSLAARGVEVHTALEAGLGTIFGHRDRIEQAVLSLVVNAEQALAEAQGPRRLMVSAARAGRELHLTIADTGRGIEPEHLEHIFDPFWTTKRPERGSAGLGLSLVHAIVSDHGGRVRVESHPGRGSTFTLEFPAAPATAEGV